MGEMRAAIFISPIAKAMGSTAEGREGAARRSRAEQALPHAAADVSPLTASIILTRTAWASPYTMLQLSA